MNWILKTLGLTQSISIVKFKSQNCTFKKGVKHNLYCELKDKVISSKFNLLEQYVIDLQLKDG